MGRMSLRSLRILVSVVLSLIVDAGLAVGQAAKEGPVRVTRAVKQPCALGVPLEVRLGVASEDPRTVRKLYLEEQLPESWLFLGATPGPTALAQIPGGGLQMSWFFAGRSLGSLVESIFYRVRPAGEAGQVAIAGASLSSETLGGGLVREAPIRGGHVACDWHVRAHRRVEMTCSNDSRVTAEVSVRINPDHTPKALTLLERIPSDWKLLSATPPALRRDDALEWQIQPAEALSLGAEVKVSYQLLARGRTYDVAGLEGQVTWKTVDDQEGQLGTEGDVVSSCRSN